MRCPPHARVAGAFHPLVERARPRRHKRRAEQGKSQRRRVRTAAGAQQEPDTDGHQDHQNNPRLGQRDIGREPGPDRVKCGLRGGRLENRMDKGYRGFQATTSRFSDIDRGAESAATE